MSSNARDSLLRISDSILDEKTIECENTQCFSVRWTGVEQNLNHVAKREEQEYND